MSPSYPAKSTYEVPVTVTDDETGDPVSLRDAKVEYVMAKSKGGRVFVTKREDDDAITFTDRDNGEMLIEINAQELEEVYGDVYEELRVSTPDLGTVVTEQRETNFDTVMTDPHEF